MHVSDLADLNTTIESTASSSATTEESASSSIEDVETTAELSTSLKGTETYMNDS